MIFKEPNISERNKYNQGYTNILFFWSYDWIILLFSQEKLKDIENVNPMCLFLELFMNKTYTMIYWNFSKWKLS